MARKQVVRTFCDRCVKHVLATTTGKVVVGDDTYELDLCDEHADRLQRDLLMWARSGRLIEPERAFSGQARLSNDIREQVWGPTQESEPEPAPAPEVVVDIRKPTPATMPTKKPTRSSTFDPDQQQFWPTNSAMERMKELGLTWDAVCDLLEDPPIITGSDREGVNIYMSPDLSVLVTDTGYVIGMRPRELGDLPESKPPTYRHGTTKIERRGKRGGIGRIGPRTMDEVRAAIKSTPGWDVSMGGKHWRIEGPNGERSTLPVTTSDWRAAMNAVSQLRRDTGLDLRKPHKTTVQAS